MIFKSLYPDITVPDVDFSSFVLQHVAQWKDQPAFIDGPSGRTLTYGQVAGGARLVAASLAKRGFGRGDVFAIYSPNVPEYAIAFHAVSMLGATLTTANPLYTADELAYQLNDTKAKYLLTIPMFMEKAIAAAGKSKVEEIFVFGEAPGATPFASLLQSDGVLPAVQINPKEDVLVMPYSSGTTGLPKGVMLTHYNLVAQMLQLDVIKNYTLGDRTLGILPFYHIYGMVVLMNFPLYRGGTCVTMPRFDLEQFLQIVQDHKVTHLYLVPPIIVALAKHPLVSKYDLSHVKVIGSGAAPLDEGTMKLAQSRVGGTIFQGYGMTETSCASHVMPEDAPLTKKLQSVGVPLGSMECKVMDVTTGAELGANQQGEIWMRGPNIMKGYLNNPEATAHTIDPDGYLHSGDIGYADDDGFFYVVDRLKELIKYKGLQVAPAELEAVLLSNPAIADAAVIPVPDEDAGELPKAFIVKKSPISAEEVMDYVAARVAPHKKIRLVEFVDAIPKSASGKILRRMLVEKERAAKTM